MQWYLGSPDHVCERSLRRPVGGELWRPQKRDPSIAPDPENDALQWARALASDWFTPAERLLKQERLDREEENVLKFRIDDGWNVKALWTGRVKSLLVEVGVSVNPVAHNASAATSSTAKSGNDNVKLVGAEGSGIKRWTGNVGVSIAYST